MTPWSGSRHRAVAERKPVSSRAARLAPVLRDAHRPHGLLLTTIHFSDDWTKARSIRQSRIPSPTASSAVTTAPPGEAKEFARRSITSRATRLAGVGKAGQHHRCLELVHTSFRAARGWECRWSWVQRQVRDMGWTAWRLEYIRLACAGGNKVELPNCGAHFCQPGLARHRDRPRLGPYANRPPRVRQPGPAPPGMGE